METVAVYAADYPSQVLWVFMLPIVFVSKKIHIILIINIVAVSLNFSETATF